MTTLIRAENLAAQTVGNSGWLASFAAGGLVPTVTGWSYLASASQFPISVDKNIGITGAANAALSGIGPAAANIGISGVALNNKVGQQKAWGAYFDGVRAITGAGTTAGIEVDITQLPGSSPLGGMNPYKNFIDGMTRGVNVSAGSDETVFGRSYAVDAAITTNNNGAAFWAGLVFRHNSLMREGLADDRSIPSSTGYARAILMAHDHGVSWYSRDPLAESGTQVEAVRMWSTVDNATTQWGMSFQDNALNFSSRAAPGASLFVIDYSATSVNFMAIEPKDTGSGPSLAVRGPDANINLLLTPKGTGRVSFAYAFGASAGSPTLATFNRMIEIVDLAGTKHYVPASLTTW